MIGAVKIYWLYPSLVDPAGSPNPRLEKEFKTGCGFEKSGCHTPL